MTTQETHRVEVDTVGLRPEVNAARGTVPTRCDGADLLTSGHSAADGDRSGDRFVGEADTVTAQDHYRTVGESFGKDHRSAAAATIP